MMGATRKTTFPATSLPPAPCTMPHPPSDGSTDVHRWREARTTAGLDRLSAALADDSAGGVKATTRKGEP